MIIQNFKIIFENEEEKKTVFVTVRGKDFTFVRREFTKYIREASLYHQMKPVQVDSVP